MTPNASNIRTHRRIGVARRARRAGAFTLIELLAASALSAVLMVVLLQVIGSLARGRGVLEQDAAAGDAPWQAELMENLRWDLLNATEGVAEPGRLVLSGHGSLDRATLAPDHRLAAVVYAIERRGARTWLVRRQIPGERASGGAWSELVCPDVTAFTIERADPGPRAGPSAGPIARSRPVPATFDASTVAVRVRVRVEGAAEPIMERVLVLR